MESMNWQRAVATVAYVPLAFVFFAWALVAGAMTRGPAGVAAFCVVASFGFLIVWQAYRVASGRSPVWGTGTKVVVGLDTLVAVYFFVAIPYLQSSFHLADEAATRANLKTIREAVGETPPARLSMLVPDSLPIIPRVKLPQTGHPISREVIFGPASAAADRGVWLYDNDESSSGFGTVIVDCTHSDSTGKLWSTY